MYTWAIQGAHLLTNKLSTVTQCSMSNAEEVKKYLVDGHLGPPWPRGLFGVQEPVLSFCNLTGRKRPISTDSNAYKTTLTTAEEGVDVIEKAVDNVDRGVGNKCGVGDVEKYPIHASVSAASTMDPPRTDSSHHRREHLDKKLYVAESHRVGHRISKGKLIPMPLTLCNKAYKKTSTQQLPLKAFLK